MSSFDATAADFGSMGQTFRAPSGASEFTVALVPVAFVLGAVEMVAGFAAACEAV